jgi:hypothetical protein
MRESGFPTPTGFSVADIRRPVHVWWGESDPNVSRAHTD